MNGSSASSKGGFDLPARTSAQKSRAKKILEGLYRKHPDAHCELDHSNPLQLLVATILSAQATDAGVNKATPRLFETFPTAQSYADATPEEVQEYIKTIGLFRNKSKAIHAAMKMIVEDFGGEVPDTMEDLLKLKGVARKTANVVLGNAFGKNEGVVVDTHVARVAHRFGLTKHTDPKKIEPDLMALFPRPHWTMLGHLLIFHGRRVCRARGALCAQDDLCRKYCSNAAATLKTTKKKKKKKEN